MEFGLEHLDYQFRDQIVLIWLGVKNKEKSIFE
jgi:hypothetical protein